MEKARFLILLFTLLSLLMEGYAIEKPVYEIVHLESDFEIRLYTESTWIAAPISEISFEKATLDGFNRLSLYTLGANLNWSRVPMTAPVVTSIVPGAGPFRSSAYSVLFYLPVKFQADPPVPLPELHLKPFVWKSHYVAVRSFSGYAKDDNIIQEAEKLAVSLRRSPWVNKAHANSSYAYSIAQYDPPFCFIGRVNEVWTDINATGLFGHEYRKLASY